MALVVSPIEDANGRIVGASTIARDITERKRAEATLHRHLAELEAVNTVAIALRTTKTLSEAISIVLDQTLAAMQTDAGSIWLFDPTSGELRVAANRGWFSQLDDAPMKPGEGMVGTVFASGQAHLSIEFAHDPVARPVTHGVIPAGWGGACVPIRSVAEPVGVILVSVPRPREISREEMKLLGSLAEMAGAFLHRMALFEETEHQLKFVRALHEIDRVISASFDLRMTLNLLLRHVIAELGVDAADVLLLHPHLQTLDYVVGNGFRTRAIQDSHLRIGESFAGRVARERHVFRVQDPATAEKSSSFATLWAREAFVTYCGLPLIVKGEVKGVLEVFQRAPHSQPVEPTEWLHSLEIFAGQAAIAIDNIQLFEELQRSNMELTVAYDSTIKSLSRALDLRDKDTEEHTERVTEMTERLARAMGIADTELVQIRRGALLHDMGKMGVPDSILHKPDKLTDVEWAIMQQHPQVAFDMLSPIKYLRSALDIPYCHHEKWDGTGYPRGLKGEQIPLAARLFAVVDVYDALTSDRPYRPAWSIEKTWAYIREQSGKHFDPTVVELFFKLGF